MNSNPPSRSRKYTVIGGDAKRKKLKPIAFEKMALIQQELALIEKQLAYLRADEHVTNNTTSNITTLNGTNINNNNNNNNNNSKEKSNIHLSSENIHKSSEHNSQEELPHELQKDSKNVKDVESKTLSLSPIETKTAATISINEKANHVSNTDKTLTQENKLTSTSSTPTLLNRPVDDNHTEHTSELPLCEQQQYQQEQKQEQQLLQGVSSVNTNGAMSNTYVQDDLISPEAAPMLLVELCQLAAAGDEVAVRTLLSAGADPNSRDYDDRTLLHIATMHHHLSIIRALLEYGADCNLVDREGATPLDVARSLHFNDVVDVFCTQFAQEGYAPLDSYADQCTSPESASPLSQHVPDFSSVPQPMVGSLIVIMMGLPGRGKTYVSQQIRRYFQWNGLPCAIFLHQAYRKKVAKTMTLEEQRRQSEEQRQQQEQQEKEEEEEKEEKSHHIQENKINQWANPMSMPEYAAYQTTINLNPATTSTLPRNNNNHDKEEVTKNNNVATILRTMNTEFEMEHLVAAALAEDMTRFLSKAGGVAILDGTHSTPQRRHAVLRAIKKTKRIKSNRVIVVEIVNNNQEKIMKNILRAKEMFPNAPDNFVELYRQIMAQHEAVYRTLNPITDGNLSYIRMEEEDTSLNMISGWMPSRLAYMLHNLSHTPVSLYLTRPGEYLDMVSGHIGGNSRLTLRGEAYAVALYEYFTKELPFPKEFAIMSSCSKRCTQTLEHFVANSSHHNESASNEDELATSSNVNANVNLFENVNTISNDNNNHGNNSDNNYNDKVKKFSSFETDQRTLNCRIAFFPTLDDLNHGDCEGLRFEDVYKTMPSTLQYIHADPYYTAWPNGECIHQVYNARLEPHIHDIQASSIPMLVVSHLHLLQGLYAYFVTDEDKAVAPQNAYQINIPYECVIKISMVGTRRVAEFVDLAKDVNQIMLERFGDIGGCPRLPPQYNMYKMRWNTSSAHLLHQQQYQQ